MVGMGLNAEAPATFLVAIIGGDILLRVVRLEKKAAS
jgi:hypothetical protein